MQPPQTGPVAEIYTAVRLRAEIVAAAEAINGAGSVPAVIVVRVKLHHCQSRYGSHDRSRTGDLKLTKFALCQLSYEGILIPAEHPAWIRTGAG